MKSRSIFTIDRTVRTFVRYFEGHGETVRHILESVHRLLQRLIPPEVARSVDREGSRLEHRAGGSARVVCHPALQRALKELAALGAFRVFVPSQYGGLELPVGIYYAIVQLVSTFETSLALWFLVHGNAMYVLNQFGTEPQKERYLPAMAAGDRYGGVAFTEPLAGSDAGSIRMRAVRRGGSFVLNGTKSWITNGGDADILITTARTGPLELGFGGVSVFVVEREADGVSVTRLEEKTGLAGSPTAELLYDNVTVPGDRVVGQLGAGGRIALSGIGMTRANIGAQAIGIAKRAFSAACDYAIQRQQGGRCIVRHPAIQERLGWMATLISAMENLLYWAASVESQGDWYVREASIAKYFSSELLQELTMRAINVFGGYGCSKEFVVEQCRREAVALPLYGGTSEVQWYIISRELMSPQAADYRDRITLFDERTLRMMSPARRARLNGLTTLLQTDQALLAQAVHRVGQIPPDRQPLLYQHLAEMASWNEAARVMLRAAATGDALDEAMAGRMVREAHDRLQCDYDHVAAQNTWGDLANRMLQSLGVDSGGSDV